MKSKTLLSLIVATSAFLNAEMGSAQSLPPSERTPQADNTLGTQVSGNGNNFNITGGLNRGQTLFHSFKDFSIPTGGAANFNNPAGTRDIISRVTGNLFSDINGTLNSNGANFLLINPNGVVFGPNARLNVGKAFAASTASGVDLVDGQGRQITFGTNPNGDAPLLKINPDVFFNVSRLNMEAKVPGSRGIMNDGTLKNQTNNPGQYIGLIGGDVRLNGGSIIAPGGKVELGGLNQAGGIGFSFDKGLQFPVNVGRADVELVTKGTSPSSIDVQSAGGGGSVNIFAKDITLRGTRTQIAAGISAESVSPNATAGDIKVDATGNIGLSEADIFNQVSAGGVGNAGNIEINTRNLFLTNGGVITSSSFGTGNAGNVKITASGGDVFFDGIKTQDNQDTTGTGAFSTIEQTGVGKGGNVEINTRNLFLTNGARLESSSKGKGDAGNVNITASDDIFFNGISNNKDGRSSGAFSEVEGGIGKGGNVEIINARNLVLTNGAQLSTTTFGKGDAGKVKVKATDIFFDGINNETGIRSGAFSSVGQDTAEGKGGNVEIDTGKLSVTNGARLSASTFGKGDAGSVIIKATDVSFNGSALFKKDNLLLASGAFSSVGEDKPDKTLVGKGGNVEITTGKLSVTNGAQLAANTFGQGDAGTIKINASGDISVTNGAEIQTLTFGTGNAGTIKIKSSGDITFDSGRVFSTVEPLIKEFSTTVEQGKVRQGGNIEINARNLSITNGGVITSSTKGKGDAGNVKITATDKISFDGINSKDDFRSAALSNVEKGGEGKGGNVEINTRNLSLTNGGALSAVTKGIGDAGNVKITASGDISFDGLGSSAFSTVEQTGVGKGGNIEINTRNLSLTNGGQLRAETIGKGAAGNVKITATDKISFDGLKGVFVSGVFSNVEAGVVGFNGGNIEINTPNLSLSNSAQIQALTKGKGDAGNIKVTATGDIFFDGFKDGFPSGISSVVEKTGVGKGGNIEINTRNLSLTNVAQVTADTRGKGDAGNVKITATGDISVDGFKDGFPSGIFSLVGQDVVGEGGGIEINTRNLSLTNGAQLNSSTFGQGDAGNISLNANTIKLNQGKIFSTSTSSTGGNINITTQDYLLLRNNGLISTNSGSRDKNGNGGNIKIDSPSIVALPGNNNISANAFQGSGGRVDINSKGLFGIKFRPIGSDFTSDITASSDFGPNGIVNISTPGTDPGKDSTVLPTVPTDASNQIAQTCNASRENKFIIAGRGGLPPNANDPLTSDVVWQDARATNSQPTANSTTNDRNKLPPPAVGLVLDGTGKAFLIAAGSEGQPTKTTVACPNGVRK
jgi:filamentous hemagglutinin family protein